MNDGLEAGETRSNIISDNGSMLRRHTSQVFRSGSMPRYGLSLTYNDCPLPNHHCKVNIPGL
jgi:hypothetical protein